MDKQAIFDKLKAALIEDFEMDEAMVTPEARLYEDLELDSIDAVELIMALEEEFQVTIPDEDAAELTVIGDIVRYIESHQA
jgi:acyl carrier protein